MCTGSLIYIVDPKSIQFTSAWSMHFTQPAVNGMRINHTESSWYAWDSQNWDFWLTKQKQFFNSPETFPTTCACQTQIRTIAPFCPCNTSQYMAPFSVEHSKAQEAFYTVIRLVLVFFKVNIVHILLSNKVFLKVCYLFFWIYLLFWAHVCSGSTKAVVSELKKLWKLWDQKS